jgi:hypothetical protein
MKRDILKDYLYYFCIEEECNKKENHVGCKKHPMALFLKNSSNSLVIPILFFDQEEINIILKDYEDYSLIVPLTSPNNEKVIGLDLRNIKSISNHKVGSNYKTGSNFASLTKLDQEVKEVLFTTLIKITKDVDDNSDSRNPKVHQLAVKIKQEINNFSYN